MKCKTIIYINLETRYNNVVKRPCTRSKRKTKKTRKGGNRVLYKHMEDLLNEKTNNE